MTILKKHFLKVVSVFLGILIFISSYDLGTPFWEEYLFKTEIIKDVNLDVTYNDDYILTNLPQVIDIKIKGSQKEVDEVLAKKSEIQASAKLDIKDDGSKIFNPETIEYNITENVQIIPLMDPINLDVSKKGSKTFAVSSKMIATESKNANIISDYSLSTNAVDVNGSDKMIDEIARVEVPINISGLKFYDQKAKTSAKPVAYDSKGEVVKNITFDPPVIDIELLSNDEFVELPISYTIVNNDSDMYVSEICTKDNQCEAKDVVKVYGDLSSIEKLNNVKYEIDLSEQKKNYVATPIVPEGVFVLEEDSHGVVVKMEEGSTKTIEGVPISVNNLSDNFQAKTKDDKSALIDVEVTGAKSIVDSLTKDDLNMSIDLSNISQLGDYEVPIQVAGSGLVDYKLESDTLKVEIVEVE